MIFHIILSKIEKAKEFLFLLRQANSGSIVSRGIRVYVLG